MICPACQAPNDDSSETCIHCGRGLYALTLGARLAGRYEITGQLGRGGMGVVYLARDLELDETVALKVLRTEIAGSEEAARRFRSEIKLARRIRHRNVCGIHEYGQDGPLRFIVMEYVEGSTLRQVLRQRGRLPASEAFDVAIEVAEGLQAVHDAGIIHRDLKATNVMLDRAGNIRLMDFGIAKRLQQDDTTGITATAQMVGTPEYMSPEQARSQKLDGRSDVYSLGILIFELFTGELPFHGETPMSVILAHLETPPPLDGVAAGWLPRALLPVLRRALAKDRNERYRSPREVGAALRAARAALAGPTLAQPRPPVQRGTAAQPLEAPSPDALGASRVTPIGTPTPVVPVTAPMPRPARPGGSPPNSRLAAYRARYLVAGGAVLAVALLVIAVASMQPWSSPAGPSAAPATPAPSALRTPPPPAVPPPTPEPPALAARAPSPEASPKPAPVSSARPPVAARIRATPTPAPLRAPEPAVVPGRAPTPAVEPESGTLRLRVVPWAEVSLDGRVLGTTPLSPVSLPPGRHTVRLQHPSYRPLNKRLIIRAGETFELDVDLREEAFPMPPQEE
jgi:serine/threonine protein kinase